MAKVEFYLQDRQITSSLSGTKIGGRQVHEQSLPKIQLLGIFFKGTKEAEAKTIESFLTLPQPGLFIEDMTALSLEGLFGYLGLQFPLGLVS